MGSNFSDSLYWSNLAPHFVQLKHSAWYLRWHAIFFVPLIPFVEKKIIYLWNKTNFFLDLPSLWIYLNRNDYLIHIQNICLFLHPIHRHNNNSLYILEFIELTLIKRKKIWFMEIYYFPFTSTLELLFLNCFPQVKQLDIFFFNYFFFKNKKKKV